MWHLLFRRLPLSPQSALRPPRVSLPAAASLPSEGVGAWPAAPVRHLPRVFSGQGRALTARRCGSQEVKDNRGKLRFGNPRRTRAPNPWQPSPARLTVHMSSPSFSSLKDSTTQKRGQKTTCPFP